MLRSNPSVVERLYSRTGREHRAVLFSSCPAGSPKAINLLECQSADTLIGTNTYIIKPVQLAHVRGNDRTRQVIQ